jgi:hypothetical protein
VIRASPKIDRLETIHKAVATSPAKPLFFYLASLALAIGEIGLLPRNVDEL